MNFPAKQMKPLVFAIIAAFALGALCSAPAEGARKDWPKRITIGGGPLQGTIQFQALGWSSVLNKVLKLNSSVESTAGATVNARLISQGRQDFGFGTSSSISDAAYHGRGFAKGKRYKNLRIMSPVDSSGVQFWTPAKSPIMKAEDIQGRRLNISRPGSGVDRFGRNLMKVVGLKPSQVTNVGHGQANRMMQDGILDVAATIGAPPHPAVASITSQLPFRVFGLGHGKWAEMMLAKYPFYVKTEIVGGMYKGNPKPVK
ncbi:MAG: TAXI family TRAP transporter solute-binding subunit, partial [Gammaproteobacteria bacterium]|nr:TAXI family TRAP transporter solute-binding subunit [Gammaproteobacteria bacterium]